MEFLFFWSFFLLFIQTEPTVATGRIINLQPTNNALFFWDTQYYDELYIKLNDTVRFNTAWGLHNLFVAQSKPETDLQASNCNILAFLTSSNWKGLFCACPPGGADGCEDVRTSNLIANNSVAPNCSTSPNLLPLPLPGLGEIFFGSFDYQFKESGTFWVVCTVGAGGSHCKNGMKVKITVGPPSESVTVHSLQPSQDPDKLSQWAFFDYPTLHVSKLDTIRFRFFANLHGILTSPVTQTSSNFPLDIPSRIIRCNQAHYRWWSGVPDAPETVLNNQTFHWITYDLKVSDVMGSQSHGSFDVICSAAGPSKLPANSTDSYGHTHCVIGGQGFNVVVS